MEQAGPAAAKSLDLPFRRRGILGLANDFQTILFQRQRLLGKRPLFIIQVCAATEAVFPKCRVKPASLDKLGLCSLRFGGFLASALFPLAPQVVERAELALGRFFTRLDVCQKDAALAFPC